MGMACVTGVHAEPTTVCTVTVNSSDEREVFRRNLPEEQFRFVELVERGRPDWLASACRQKVRCDVLVVSGHFAGTEFYSSRPEVNETLPIDEMERAQCSESCPELFSQLKEVYLFGCDTLKPEPVRSAMPEIVRGLVRAGQSRAEAERLARALSERYAESSRDLMRRLFPDVPAIYGFSSLAPYGRVAGPLLTRYFESGAATDFGSGRPSERLLKLLGPASMTLASGARVANPEADPRGEACRYFDERVSRAEKVASMQRTLGGEMGDVRMSFARIEKFFAALTDGERSEPLLAHALEQLAGDGATRARYLGLARETEDPALRVRMIDLAQSMGWLTRDERRAEQVRMIVDMLAANAVGYGEVDLICSLNADRALDRELDRFGVATLPANATARAAAQACLGSAAGRASVIRALASANDEDVQVAQAYLRHRPLTGPVELRSVALGVSSMPPAPAQVRALETLARHHISDREVLERMARLYASARSASVQRAVAEVFLRSDYHAIGGAPLVELLRQHRVQAPQGGDIVDVLIERLQAP
jgi:hypothetical protein